MLSLSLSVLAEERSLHSLLSSLLIVIFHVLEELVERSLWGVSDFDVVTLGYEAIQVRIETVLIFFLVIFIDLLAHLIVAFIVRTKLCFIIKEVLGNITRPLLLGLNR